MSNMKCLFCGKETEFDITHGVFCRNCFLYGDEKLWQELIRTRKALDKARYGLEWIFGYENVPEYVVKHVREILEQINEIKGGKDERIE